MHTLRASTIFLAALLPLAAAIPEPIHVENGQVTGVAGNIPEIRVFKGLPFAAPPVGDLRWKAPKSPAKWDGVKAADKFSNNCVQAQAGGGAFPPSGGDRTATAMSEDCLYLNVYTGAKAAKDKLPVMVWIHGGALTSGAGAIYEGEELAKKGVVFVSVNYRMGVYGFFAHPELTKESDFHSSGNYGFLDQIKALEWVQKNIALFGGDPKRVTIFGESAGSWSVNYLTASPLAKGLFQRAIGESGAKFSVDKRLAEMEQAGVKFAESLKAKSIAELRAKPASELRGQFQVDATVDGWFLPDSVYNIYAKGKQNDVPMLIGSNNDEGTIFTRNSTVASLKQQSAGFGSDADKFLQIYSAKTDDEAFWAAEHVMRDRTFGWEMRTWGRAQVKTGKSPVYLYYFAHVPPAPNAARLGAQHGAEISYAFNWPNGKGFNPEFKWTDYDRQLSEQVSSYWVNFATKGDPNGKGLVKWPAYKGKDEDGTIGFNDKVEIQPLPNKAALDLIDAQDARKRAGK